LVAKSGVSHSSLINTHQTQPGVCLIDAISNDSGGFDAMLGAHLIFEQKPNLAI
jgi:hypothetical protein